MKSVITVVKEKILQDPIAMESLERGLLNTTAYAREIHKDIESLCKKEVKQNTIVTAINRLRTQVPKQKDLIPTFTMGSMAIQLHLCEIACTKGAASASLISWIDKQPREPHEFFQTIQGNNETDLIVPERFLHQAKAKIKDPQMITGIITNLAAITLSYPSELTLIPNVGYTLIRALALQKINLIEVVSSFSEITFVVADEDVSRSIAVLNPFLRT